MKHCAKCGKSKPYEEFYKDRRASDGLQSSCRLCVRESQRKHYEDNRDKMRESQYKYRERNRGKAKERSRKWREDNLDEAREKNRKWYEENREKVLEYQRKWRTENRDKRRTYHANRRARKLGTLTEVDFMASAAYREAIARDPCFYCGASEEDSYHDDHYFPIAKGGDDRWYNLVRACQTCNLSKNTKCGTAFILKKRI